jgi:quercetin dioxygenase-like cupin family protein
MAKRMSILPILAVFVVVSATMQQAGLAQPPVKSQVVPLKAFSKLATDRRFETVSGDPAVAGAPFVIRIHAEAGYVIMPHTHEVDENIVVVKGSWALGMGTHFNREALEPMEVGDFGLAPRNMVHFALAKTATIIQVHGIGPFATQWLVPMYELTAGGVLFKTSAGDPGRLEKTSPERCFALKMGAHVRGPHGEGVIVGAQCTPDELTQYRVEKKDGILFWAQRDELSAP